jgi:hypothetical protein
MTENRIFTLCRMITWVVFLRMFWNFISSLAVKRGRSLSFLVGTISKVLVMEIGWTIPANPPVLCGSLPQKRQNNGNHPLAGPLPRRSRESPKTSFLLELTWQKWFSITYKSNMKTTHQNFQMIAHCLFTSIDSNEKSREILHGNEKAYRRLEEK